MKYIVKLANFSVKWRVFNSGFNGQKRLHAIWKALLKITLVDACFSMSFFKFKTSMQNATFFEKQDVIFVNWRSRSPLKKKHIRVNSNLASKYSRWGPYQYYQIIVSSVNVNQCITRLKSYEYGYGGIAQIFLKLIAEKLLVFRGKMCAKMAKEWF